MHLDKCQNPFFLFLSLFFFSDKAQFIPIDQLVMPPKNRQIRAVDEDFLKELVENVKSQPEGNYEPLFVLVKGVTSQANFDKDKADYEYEVLGGTHLTQATRQLHEKFPDDIHFSGRIARVYVGLTDEEALWLGAMHNNTGAFRHGMKYKDEVIIPVAGSIFLVAVRYLSHKHLHVCINVLQQVMICRSQLFLRVQGDLNDDPPVPAESWRDVCSSLINKPVSSCLFFPFLPVDSIFCSASVLGNI